jgi:hypothetical protein
MRNAGGPHGFGNPNEIPPSMYQTAGGPMYAPAGGSPMHPLPLVENCLIVDHDGKQWAGNVDYNGVFQRLEPVGKQVSGGVLPGYVYGGYFQGYNFIWNKKNAMPIAPPGSAIERSSSLMSPLQQAYSSALTGHP